MSLTLTVHRGTRAIGGSCIEIAAPGGERLILDAGRPLDAARDARNLLPPTLDRAAPATVLFSHAHMDHWGLIDELPAHWPLWAGGKAAELMRLSAELFGDRITRPIATWTSRTKPFAIGSFTIAPILTDHSAPDAYMLLIEVHGRRILYTGDFRIHGRKAKLVEALIALPPPAIDVLVMEGTNLGQDKPVVTEAALEEQFVQLARATPRHLFVQWSAQNVDRTVTLYRAALKTGRQLVIDLYAADVLQRIGGGTGLPVPGPDFPHLRVLITPGGKRLYARQGRQDWADGVASSPMATSRRRLAKGRAIIMCRNSMLRDFAKDGLGFTAEDAYAFSNWNGYLDPTDPHSGWAQAAAAGATTVKLHTSGHASPADLSRFAIAIAPKVMIGVHGLNWRAPAVALPPVRSLEDGEAWEVP